MRKSIPEVRFEYASLLSEHASEGLNELWGDGSPLESFDFYSRVARKYEKWWKEDNDQILKGLCSITGLEFYQNTIDVHVAPWFYAFSSPMVLGVTFRTKDDLVNVLTHEIIHRLLTDNKTYARDYDFVKLWQSMFGKDKAWNALIHIPVHALMEELYIDVIDRPDLLKLDKATTHKHGYKDYITAWEYVEANGYKNITDKLREHIEETKKETKNKNN